jgi:dihydroorotate dehydrogenase
MASTATGPTWYLIGWKNFDLRGSCRKYL